MATLEMTIDCDSKGILTYEHPEGRPAVELGTGGAIQLNLGVGFNGKSQFDQLVVSQGGQDYTLDVTNSAVQPVTATFPDGAVIFLYNNLRVHTFIRNDGQDPAIGEDDLEFSVTISDSSGQHTLDPEIRVRSGTGSGTATWVPSSGSPADLPDVVVRKTDATKGLPG